MDVGYNVYLIHTT